MSTPYKPFPTTLQAFNATSLSLTGAFCFFIETVLPQMNVGLPLSLAPCFHLPFGIMYLHTYKTSSFRTPILQSKAVGINFCTAKTSDLLKNLLATSLKLVSQAAFSTYREKLVYGAFITTGFPKASNTSAIFLWCSSSLLRKTVGMRGTSNFSNSAYWWILLAHIFMDSGSSMTLSPSSQAVLDTMYAG